MITPLIDGDMFLFIFVLTIHWHVKITLQANTSTLLSAMLTGLSGEWWVVGSPVPLSVTQRWDIT